MILRHHLASGAYLLHKYLYPAWQRWSHLDLTENRRGWASDQQTYLLIGRLLDTWMQCMNIKHWGSEKKTAYSMARILGHQGLGIRDDLPQSLAGAGHKALSNPLEGFTRKEKPRCQGRPRKRKVATCSWFKAPFKNYTIHLPPAELSSFQPKPSKPLISKGVQCTMHENELKWGE